ncbi:MAG: hypothetical protein WC028_04465 [Candidatus Obscuribacterales bacterium]
MADRLENQAPRPEVDPVKAEASGRSLADAFSDQESKATSDLGSPDNSTALTARISSEKTTTPAKLPTNSAKPESDTATRSSQKVEPGAPVPVPKDTERSREAVTPTIHPGDKALNPGTNPGVTPKAGEQQRASTEGAIPKAQNLADQPTGQRQADVLPTQPVTNAVKAPDRAPDKLNHATTEQHSDRALLPGLAIVGPEGKVQQGSLATVGTSDGKVHDPVVAKPQDAASANAYDPAIAKPDVQAGKSNDTGLKGAEPGIGALTGKIQAGPDHIKSDDAVRQPVAHNADVLARQANGESVLKNYSAADGTRSGIDHTIQGIIAKGADGKSPDGKSDGIRSGPVSLTDGKIADGKVDGDRGQARLPDGRMLDGKIADGKTPGVRPGEVKLGDGKIGDGSTAGVKPGDRVPDGKVGGKTGGEGGSSGPSAFIQFIESQAGIRGFGLPAKSENTKSEGKTDSKSDGKADGSKAGSANTDGKTFVPGGAKGDAKSGAGVPGDTKSGAGIAGGRSNAIDGFLGLVESVKDNIKGSLKNLGDRTQPSVPLREGELAAVAMRGKMPPVRDDITSEQILAVLIPKGFVGWSIVRSPGIKPSDSPLPGSRTKIDGGKLVDGKANDGRAIDDKAVTGKLADGKPLDSKQSESKPFDINNPDAKSRPFIQLHGVDSNYTGAGVRRTEPAADAKSDQIKLEPPKVDQSKPIPVKAEPLTDTKVVAVTTGTAATPYLDVSTSNQINDQSATRQTIPPEPKSRRQLIEEQEHTLPSASESEIAPTKEGEKRLRYVNSALDAQEATWNSEEDDANNGRELQAPLGRYTYIVRAGDTVESVAVVELNDLSLAPLLFKKNKKYVLPEEEYGRHPLVAGVVIDLPTPAEIKAFRQF